VEPTAASRTNLLHEKYPNRNGLRKTSSGELPLLKKRTGKRKETLVHLGVLPRDSSAIVICHNPPKTTINNQKGLGKKKRQFLIRKS